MLKTNQSKTKDEASQDKTGRDKTVQNRTRQDKTSLGKGRQDNTTQHSTAQHSTTQDNTRQSTNNTMNKSKRWEKPKGWTITIQKVNHKNKRRRKCKLKVKRRNATYVLQPSSYTYFSASNCFTLALHTKIKSEHLFLAQIRA